MGSLGELMRIIGQKSLQTSHDEKIGVASRMPFRIEFYNIYILGKGQVYNKYTLLLAKVNTEPRTIYALGFVSRATTFKFISRCLKNYWED